MEKLFCTEHRGEDLIRWSDQLDTLGGVVSFLGYKDKDGEFLSMVGEHLGIIISDYAKAINETVGSACQEIDKFFKDDGSETFELKRRVDWLKGWDHPNWELHLEEIDKTFKEFKPIFYDIMELNSTLCEMREEVVSKINELQQKRALAKADTETKAQEVDRVQTDLKSNVA